jgi:hypothetical protein
VALYVVRYLPGPKIEIKLPGTEHIVTIATSKSRKSSGIVIVNPFGAVSTTSLYDDQRVAQTSDSLQSAAQL